MASIRHPRRERSQAVILMLFAVVIPLVLTWQIAGLVHGWLDGWLERLTEQLD